MVMPKSVCWPGVGASDHERTAPQRDDVGMLLPDFGQRGCLRGLEFRAFSAERQLIDGNLFGLTVDRDLEAVGQHLLQHGAEHRGLRGGVFPLRHVGLRDPGVDIVIRLLQFRRTGRGRHARGSLGVHVP